MLRSKYLLLAGIVALLLGYTVFQTFAVRQPLPGSAPIIWVASGMERIGLYDQPGSSKRSELSAARAEYEPFQVVIQAPLAGLSNVTMTVSDLVSANGTRILSANLTLYREQYIYVSHGSPNRGGSNQPLGAGWYPDPLIPFGTLGNPTVPVDPALRAVPFALAAGKNQPIWVDVFVPPQTPADIYTGTFQVVSDQGQAQGEIQLTVWNFALPASPSLRSGFEFTDDSTLNLNIMTELLKHKLMPKRTPPQHSLQLQQTYGLNSSAIGFWSGADNRTCSLRPLPTVDQFKQVASQYASGLFLYNHTADEVDGCPNFASLIGELKTWGRNLHAVGVANMLTIKPIPELADDGTGHSVVDIWTMLPKMYEDSGAQIDQARQRNEQIWSYNALVQDDYSPKWQIDFAPINYRIQPGFLSQSLNLSGIYYWNVNEWTSDPWKNVQTYVDGKESYPGEGMLVYPGQPAGVVGVVPSIRLKWLREGVEDYEYVAILKGRERADLALEIARSVAPDWHNWTRDPLALDAARSRLAEAIIATNPNTISVPLLTR